MMAVPKQVKITKDGVEFISNADLAQYNVYQLCRAALKDIALLVLKRTRDKAYKRHMKKGNARKRAFYAFRFKIPFVQGGLPYLTLGIAHNTWYGAEQETGSSKNKKYALLTDTTRENINQIKEITEHYMKFLNDDYVHVPDESEMSTERDENGR